MLDSLLTKAEHVVNRHSRIMLIADAILSKVAPQSTASALTCECNWSTCTKRETFCRPCLGHWCCECVDTGYPCDYC